jgi:hypothetical protein
MSRPRRRLWLFLSALLLAPLAPVHAQAPVDTAALGRARRAADALGKELMGRLLAAGDRHGPAGALAFCADSAQLLTARFRTQGLHVARTALRVRNPANRPDSAERRILQYLEARQRAGALPAEHSEVRVVDGRRVLQYARPIVLLDRCVTCHGDRAQIPASLRAVIAERYPMDSAVGFRPGDLRGMITVRVPLAAR